jgi:hypothetical protein
MIITPDLFHLPTLMHNALFINNMYVTLLSSTCFEHQHAYLQEDKLYYHSIWYRHCLKQLYNMPDESRLSSALLVRQSRDQFLVVSLFPWFLPTKPCTLRSTQPLKMSTRDFSWGKGGRCVWLTTYHPCSAEHRDDPGP